MAQFTYKALDSQKRIVDGTISALTRKEAGQLIAKKGLSPITVQAENTQKRINGKLPAIERITFCRYISTMLTSGLSLSEGISVMRDETKNALMKQILTDITYSLEQGQQLSTVFERYPTVFEPYFLTLTRAGELSGTLADVFKYLESELRAEYSLNSKVKGALLYPAVVFTAMIGIGVLMFFFVLPQIGKVFLSLQLPLPAFTKFMFQFSISLSKQVIPIIIGVITLAICSFFAIRSPKVRHLLMRMISPIPMIRNLIKKIDLARFNRIFATLLRSAVPITQALEISLESLSWYEYRQLSKIFPEELSKGKSLSDVIKEHKAFPTLMNQMIAAGEKSGTIDTALSDLAGFYEEEVEEELKSLTQILEPVLMLLVGISVGVMILSIIAPIYSVVGSFQQAAGTPGGR